MSVDVPGILGMHRIKGVVKTCESGNVGKLLREEKELLLANHVLGILLSALLAYLILTAALGRSHYFCLASEKIWAEDTNIPEVT